MKETVTNKTISNHSIYDRITSRHIAKLLTRLGDTIAPVTISEIKRQMRFLTEDIINAKEETEQ